MTGLFSDFHIPVRWVIHSLFGLALGTLVLSSASPASAAMAGLQPALLSTAVGPAKALGSGENANVIKVGRRGRGRRHRGHRRHRGFRGGIYLGLPYYGYYSYPRYRSYRYTPYRGRCAKWRRRCAVNWGYRTSSYYGCLRYHGCR